MKAIGRQDVILFPGVAAVLANGVPFATYPQPFLGPVCGVFILTASVLSIGLGVLVLRKGNKVGRGAIILGLIALLLGAFLPALFTVRESAHRAAEAPALCTVLTLSPHKRSRA
jgi:hypothetical protein